MNEIPHSRTQTLLQYSRRSRHINIPPVYRTSSWRYIGIICVFYITRSHNSRSKGIYVLCQNVDFVASDNQFCIVECSVTERQAEDSTMSVLISYKYRQLITSYIACCYIFYFKYFIIFFFFSLKESSPVESNDQDQRCFKKNHKAEFDSCVIELNLTAVVVTTT